MQQNQLSDEDDPCGLIYNGLHSGYTTLIALSSQKWAHVREFPWLLWHARDRSKAQNMLVQYRAGVIAGIEFDRVSNWWLDGSSTLSVEYINWCENGVLGSELDIEISALEHAKFDGTCGEAIHGDVARIIKHSTAASFKMLAATVRQKQQLEYYDVWMHLGWSAKISKYWRRHKVVLARTLRACVDAFRREFQI